MVNKQNKDNKTLTDNTIPTKIIEQYPYGVYELQILKDTTIFC